MSGCWDINDLCRISERCVRTSAHHIFSSSCSPTSSIQDSLLCTLATGVEIENACFLRCTGDLWNVIQWQHIVHVAEFLWRRDVACLCRGDCLCHMLLLTWISSFCHDCASLVVTDLIEEWIPSRHLRVQICLRSLAVMSRDCCLLYSRATELGVRCPL